MLFIRIILFLRFNPDESRILKKNIKINKKKVTLTIILI